MNTSKVWAWRAAAIRPIFAIVDDNCVNRAQLARKYGISRSMLWQYETGRLPIPGPLLDWLIAQLQLNADIISPDMRQLVEQKPRKQLAKGA
jgi:transcriptional regulator with XRE-family HTH domain